MLSSGNCAEEVRCKSPRMLLSDPQRAQLGMVAFDQHAKAASTVVIRGTVLCFFLAVTAQLTVE